MLNISSIRKEYQLKSLDIKDLHTNPFLQFKQWFHEAEKAKVAELNTMVLATATLQGRPSSRVVLLKGMDKEGFIFFTNYESRKGKELAENPFGSSTFFWSELERQVIFEGNVERLAIEESESYFFSRPRGSRLGAWSSRQDQVIPNREALEETFRHFEKLYEGKDIPLPPYWGGFRIKPIRFEFWQGRPNRLHDRFRYIFEDAQWKIERLAP